jgi:uridine kinase
VSGLVNAAEVERRLGALPATPRLIAIDGAPLSGKSTLAERLAERFGWPILGFDDFYRPAPDWPADIAPAFPFPFFRLDEFHAALRELKATGGCSWRPIDWPTLTVQPEPVRLEARGPVIVEGCSVLDPALTPLYDFSIFVESDRASLLAAQHARDGDNALAADWRRLFLPSVDIYLATKPGARADLIVAGRGLG